MAITVYDDVILSNRIISAGIRGKQVRRNSRVKVDSGLEFINIVWTQTLRQYEIGIVPLARADWMDIEALHEVTEGGAYGFLLEDPKDSTVLVTDGIADALTSTTFQLYKRYTEPISSRTKDRKITRPKESTFNIYTSGVLIDPANHTLDAETGIITIPSAPAEGTLTWSGRFYVPVHFLDDSIDWQLIAPGPDPDRRFWAGPSCVLEEIRE